MRLLTAGVVSILLALVSFAAPVHAGADPCGSIVRPGPSAWTADCGAYQRLLLGSGGSLLAAGVAMIVAARHVRVPADPDDDQDPSTEEQGAASGISEGTA